LSLEQAKTIMLASGPAIETANINMRANKAKSRSYYEAVDTLNELMASTGLRLTMTPPKPSRTSRELTNLTADFAAAQTPRNYDAELNKIVRDTVESYYQLALVKENLRISRDNVALQEKLYQNTQSKFNLGVVSKQDVLKAEIGLNEAKIKAEGDELSYDIARMNFNIDFGFNLMQNIEITDALEEVPLSEIPLEEAIAKALENRNEMHEATYLLKTTELSLTEAGNRYSRTSSKYLEAQAALLGIRAISVNMPKTIEIEVKSKYMNMTFLKSKLEFERLNIAGAKETHRLANLQFDAGMATLTDVQQALMMVYGAEMSYARALLEYNLAIISYEQSTTVGTYSVKL